MNKGFLFFIFYFLLIHGNAQTVSSTLGEASVQDSLNEIKRRLAIMPAAVYFDAAPGKQQTQFVSIINNLDSPSKFNLSLADWERDSIGEHRYYEPGTTTNSCSPWVTLDKTYVEIPPFTTEKIAVTMTIPDTASSEMKWSMLFIQGAAEKVAPRKSGKFETIFEKSTRVGVHLYHTPPGLQKKEMKLLSFARTTDRRRYTIECKNTGSIQLRCNVYLELTSLETGERTKLDPAIFPVFPGQVRKATLTIPENIKSGKYTALAIIDAGDDDVPLEASQMEVEIK